MRSSSAERRFLFQPLPLSSLALLRHRGHLLTCLSLSRSSLNILRIQTPSPSTVWQPLCPLCVSGMVRNLGGFAECDCHVPRCWKTGLCMAAALMCSCLLCILQLSLFIDGKLFLSYVSLSTNGVPYPHWVGPFHLHCS